MRCQSATMPHKQVSDTLAYGASELTPFTISRRSLFHPILALQYVRQPGKDDHVIILVLLGSSQFIQLSGLTPPEILVSLLMASDGW